MKTYKMKEEIVNVVIATFADYVENYYHEGSSYSDVPGIVDEHFDEFIEWASDDLVIDEEEETALRGTSDPSFRASMIEEVIQEFRMILGVRKYKALYPITDPARP